MRTVDMEAERLSATNVADYECDCYLPVGQEREIKYVFFLLLKVDSSVFKANRCVFFFLSDKNFSRNFKAVCEFTRL